MTIEKLNSTASIIASLRTEKKGESKGLGSKPMVVPENNATPGSKSDIKVLREELANLVKHINIIDADSVKAVTPKIVRSILLWQYGPQLREHPEWTPMLEAISTAIETHKASQENFLKLLSELKD